MQAAILDDDDDEDDLEECWRDLRPGMGRYTLSDVLKGVPAYLSISMGATKEARQARLGELDTAIAHDLRVVGTLLDEPVSLLARLVASCGKKFRLDDEKPVASYMTALLRASRAQSRVKCRTLTRAVPMGRVLEVLHDTDISPLGAFEEDFVVNTMTEWAAGNYQPWGDEELSLLQTTREDVEAEIILTPAMRQKRVLHLLFLGGVYGLFERAVLVLPDLETLVRTDLITSDGCRARAHEIDSLLEEIIRWNHHFSSCLTVVLGWSGHAEDAVLLRGLCEPLMQKIETSKLWLP